MLHHEHPALRFLTPLVSGATQHRLNLLNGEVKEQLVDHFHVCTRHTRQTYTDTM